jgi:hypothetical protein
LYTFDQILKYFKKTKFKVFRFVESSKKKMRFGGFKEEELLMENGPKIVAHTI